MKGIYAFVFLLSFVFVPLSSHAAYTVYGSGTGRVGEAISATAKLEIVQHNFGSGNVDTLQITLTNTADTTFLRPNLLTGFFFSLSGVGNLVTTTAGFDGLAATVRTSTTSIYNVDIAPAVSGSSPPTGTDGTFQLRNDSFGTANSGGDFSAYDYGIATVGMGLGFNGAAVNGDDYGIAAAGIDLADTNYANLPVIDSYATFWIIKPAALTSIEEQFVNGRFTYGSLPDYDLEAAPIPIPEPATMLLFGTGLVGVACASRKRRK